MGRRINLTGMKFGRLAVLHISERRDSNGNVHWVCRCDCGAEKEVSSRSLRTGDTQSCGCYFLEVAEQKGRSKKMHGKTGTRTHNIWMNMRYRCENPNDPKFKDYGGRGIKVCSRWQSFDAFIADMGECPHGMTIERENVNGDYEPGNCVWASQKTQQNNRRNNVRIEFMGHNLTLAQWEDRTGIKQDTIRTRLQRGWPVTAALTNKPWGRGIVSHA